VYRESSREVYQQDEGLPGMLEIDLTEDIEMEVDEESLQEICHFMTK
jgi:hypothetical protein